MISHQSCATKISRYPRRRVIASDSYPPTRLVKEFRGKLLCDDFSIAAADLGARWMRRLRYKRREWEL